MPEQPDRTLQEILERLDRIESQIEKLNKAVFAEKPAAVEPPPLPPPLPERPVPPPLPPVEPKKPVPAKPATSISFENALGTQWIGRIGMVAIVFAVGFFLKYSFDNHLIGETGRIILGIVSGCCFLAGGDYFQKKKGWPLYGQILTGGGLAILYFSLYAAFAFYKLIPQLPAFAALIAVTTTGMTLAIRYSARAIAVIGMLGGFLTPVMLSTGQNQPIALFSYVGLLNIGILTVLYYRRWSYLSLIAFFGTVLLYAGWHFEFFSSEQRTLALIITTLLFFLFHIYQMALRADTSPHEEYESLALAGCNVFFLYGAFIAQHEGMNDWTLKSLVLGISFFEVASAAVLQRIRPSQKLMMHGLVALSIIFNVIAVFTIFDLHWISPVLAVEMVLFVFMGVRFNRLALRSIGYLLGIILLIRFVEDMRLILGPFDVYHAFLNVRFYICAITIAGFYGIIVLLARRSDILHQYEQKLTAGIVALCQVLSVVLLSVEVQEIFRHRSAFSWATPLQFRYMSNLSLSVLWVIYASFLIGIGIGKKLRLLRLLGMALVGIAVLKVFLLDLSSLGSLYRILSFVVLGIALLALSYFYNRFKTTLFGSEHEEK